jgi:hypothetical protein
MSKVTGMQAIEMAERDGLTLNKYADPTEGARDGLSIEEAREIAKEDPELIYLDRPEIKINVLRDGGEWFAARWIDGVYDGCDSLEIDDDASTDDALTAAEHIPLSVDGPRVIRRVDDV